MDGRPDAREAESRDGGQRREAGEVEELAATSFIAAARRGCVSAW